MGAPSAKEAAVEKKEEAAARLEAARERWPVLDHLIRTQQHYGSVKGSTLAGAVTYFGFLSFFPIMALAFAVIGYVSRIYPDAQAQLVAAIESVLPGLVGGDHGIPISTFEDAAGAAAGFGALGVLYSGLGWLSGMRNTMMLTFEVHRDEQPNFLVGKLRDLLALVLIGVTLVLSVAIAGYLSNFSDGLLAVLGLGSDQQWAATLVGVGMGLAANVLLFLTIFRLLADPPIPPAALVKGALFGAAGFELLKWASQWLIASTKSQPAFQVFGIALILVVWIYYMSRLMVYAASWAHTDRAARAARDSAVAPPPGRHTNRGTPPAERMTSRDDAVAPPPGRHTNRGTPPAERMTSRDDAGRGAGRTRALVAGGLGLLMGLLLGRRSR